MLWTRQALNWDKADADGEDDLAECLYRLAIWTHRVSGGNACQIGHLNVGFVPLPTWPCFIMPYRIVPRNCDAL